MKIALTCPYSWDAPGGVQVHVRELGEQLIARDHDVLALAPSRIPPPQEWVHGVGRPVDVPYNASVAPICPWPASGRRTVELLRAFAPDVIHVHEPLTPSTSFFAMRSGVAPVVATFHSGATRALLYDVAAPLLRRQARRIAVRIAVSRAAAAFAGRRIGGGYQIVGNGVDVDRFRDATAADLGPGPSLLFVGRLDQRKGFPTAVETFARLAPRFEDLSLVVAGDGPDRTALDRLPPDVRSRVHMLGHVPNVDLPPVVAACDLFLAPSVGGESFGVVLVEAMAAGLPVVASRIPGYDEVITNEVDGLLVPPRHPDVAAEAVSRLLDDPAMARRLGEAGRIRASSFSWEQIARRLEALYRQAIGRG